MAITQAMCTSFKQDLLDGTVNFRTSGNTIYMALYTNGASLTASTTQYTTAGEVTSVGTNYTTGGQELGKVNPTTSGTTAYTDFSPDEIWGTSTITARGALVYNQGSANDESMIVLDFGSDKSSSNGDFTVVFPNPDGTNAIIRIA